jgi:hypothetical protein
LASVAPNIVTDSVDPDAHATATIDIRPFGPDSR